MASRPISDQYRLDTKTSKTQTDLSDVLNPPPPQDLVIVSANQPSNFTAVKNLIKYPTNQSLSTSFMFYFNYLLLFFIFISISMYKQVLYYYHVVNIKVHTLTYYPNKSPQVVRDDIIKLNKLPRVVSCILDLKHNDDENGGVDGLIGNISELTAWSISAGIQNLVIYEYNGVIIQNYLLYLPLLIKVINKNLATYFGSEEIPLYSIKIPHNNLIIYSNNNYKNVVGLKNRILLEITLLSRTDGKPTIVELTKTMSELAVNKELSISDITIELIDEELIELVGPEPDLLISFGPNLDLQDYPPWHIRLTEIYWEPDNKDVNYAIFLRALQQFANCKLNVGK